MGLFPQSRNPGKDPSEIDNLDRYGHKDTFYPLCRLPDRRTRGKCAVLAYGTPDCRDAPVGRLFGASLVTLELDQSSAYSPADVTVQSRPDKTSRGYLVVMHFLFLWIYRGGELVGARKISRSLPPQLEWPASFKWDCHDNSDNRTPGVALGLAHAYLFSALDKIVVIA